MLLSVLRQHRKNLGLSQQELAQQCQLSLATLQAIEANRANPTLQSCERLLNAMGLQLHIIEAAPNWDVLSALGIPIAPMGKGSELFLTLSAANLCRCLKLACRYLAKHPRRLVRERKAVQATLLAIERHWSGLYGDLLSADPFVQGVFPRRITGEHLKLYRMAKSSLGHFL